MQLSRRNRLLFLLLWIMGALPQGGSTQDSKKSANTYPDYSAEAYVIEESSEVWSFENDGTGTRERMERVRIQSDAAIERYGLITVPYQKAVESADLDYVRVRKPDGSVIATPMDDLQDMPAEITREAPFYSDLREKQLAVKGLSTGDVIEYRCRWHMSKPLIPGQFWMSSTFPRNEVVLQQTLQVSIPSNRSVKFKSAGVEPMISDKGQQRIYTWTRSNLEVHRSSKAELADYAIHGSFPAPDVQLSSFQSWEEIGRWYGELLQNRLTPSAEIRSKAAELIKSAADDETKIEAIYDYVSTQYRYIGVGFGIGRYQPHFAGEVLNNRYGDCKDKHTLLASLLAAAGIPAYAALISSSHSLDADVPSPAQFNHVITAVPRGKDFLWLDTTTEVAPLGLLATQIRNKRALVIFPDKPASFLATPVNPPFPTSWTFKINAKLDDSGMLEGRVEQTMHGYLEVGWRSAIRHTPRSQWKEVIQKLSYALGFGGEVSDVTVSLPEAIETPLHLTYSYKRKDYPNWKEHRIVSPSPMVFLPPFEEEGKLPEHLWLGSSGEFRFESKVELPKGYVPELPPNRDLKEDFAEYHSTYAVQENTLVIHHRVLVKNSEVAGETVKTYQTLAEEARKDLQRLIPVSLQSGQSPVSSAVPSRTQVFSGWLRGIAVLPDSADPKALELEQDARNKLRQGLFQSAIFQRGCLRGL